MAVKAEKDYRQTTTAVYYRTNSSAAYAPEYETVTEPRRIPKTRTVRNPDALPRSKPELSVGKKVLSIACVAAAASVLLVVMFRYASICNEYKQLSDIEKNISDVKGEVQKLEIDVNCGVAVSEISSAADELDMDYPTSSQVVRVMP